MFTEATAKLRILLTAGHLQVPGVGGRHNRGASGIQFTHFMPFQDPKKEEAGSTNQSLASLHITLCERKGPLSLR